MSDLEIDERVWHIQCNGVPVQHLFDANGSETFDPTEAVEWCAPEQARTRFWGIQPLKENDVLTFTLIMDGANG